MMGENQTRAMALLKRSGAFLDGHFVFTTGVHCATYINKDAVFAHPRITDELCRLLAGEFDKASIQVVVAPEKGAINLGHGVARWLEKWRVGNPEDEILSVYAEKSAEGFTIRRGYEKLIPGKRVLIVEDQLTTGGSALKTVQAVVKFGGIPVGVGAINNGGVTAEGLGVPKLETLLAIKQKTYQPHECPMCRDNLRVNTEVGHGKAFLEQLSSVAAASA